MLRKKMSRFFRESQVPESQYSEPEKKDSLTSGSTDSANNSRSNNESNYLEAQQGMDTTVLPHQLNQIYNNKSAIGFRTYHSLSAGVITTRSYTRAASTSTISTPPGTVSSTRSLGSESPSPQIGKKGPIWRSVGSKIKTKDIVKKWQSLANGKTGSKKSLPQCLESNDFVQTKFSEEISTEPKQEKKNWKVHVWCKLVEELLVPITTSTTT